MKTKDAILNDLVSDTISQTNKISFFGKNSVIRGILSAIAFVLSEIWHDLYQLIRGAHVQTAKGIDLDKIAERTGITRRGATKSTVVLLFNGEQGTIIPAGTAVKSTTSGIVYITLTEIILGKNSSIKRPLLSNILGDIVLAESILTGSSTAVSPNELTTLVSITGNITVTNLAPSFGGLDNETDEELRERIINRASLLNQGTKAFYQSLAQSANDDVLNSVAVYDPQNSGIKIYLLSRSYGQFSDNELINIANSIYANQRALQPVKCLNADILSLEFSVYLELLSGYSIDEIQSQIAVLIANLLEPKLKEFATTIEYYPIYAEIIKIEGIKRITTFLLNNKTVDVKCGLTQVPKFSILTVNTVLSEKTAVFEYNFISG